MIDQLVKFPGTTKFILACSGGVDSMAIADFYWRGGKNFDIAYFNHGTPQSEEMYQFLKSWAHEHSGIVLHTAKISRSRHKDESLEEYWRNERYSWLNSFDCPVVTCHHLDDCVETWIFSSLHGNPKLISLRNKNVVRPFLTTKKHVLIDWCNSHSVKWIDDVSNEDINFPRNRIRHCIVPQALAVNPGLHKVVKKKILSENCVTHVESKSFTKEEKDFYSDPMWPAW
jgi:tRNA(Ile)-lysidine synthase